jgi:hypothetical protein
LAKLGLRQWRWRTKNEEENVVFAGGVALYYGRGLVLLDFFRVRCMAFHHRLGLAIGKPSKLQEMARPNSPTCLSITDTLQSTNFFQVKKQIDETILAIIELRREVEEIICVEIDITEEIENPTTFGIK